MAYTTIDDPSLYFQIALYTGNGNTGKNIPLSSANFTGEYVGQDIQPDWIWIKQRGATTDHGMFDSSRGVTKNLKTNAGEAESTEAQSVTGFGSNDFTLGSSGDYNGADDEHVAWIWKANAGTETTNQSESGSQIACSVQANTTAKFSIITYTGTGGNGHTFLHGLGSTPKVIIIKLRTGADRGWIFYHHKAHATPQENLLLLNTTAAVADLNRLDDTAPNSTEIAVSDDTHVNADSKTYVSYAFDEVQGYSKFGSYKGNGNADGPFVYLGFKPAFVIIKSSTKDSQSWHMLTGIIATGKNSNPLTDALDANQNIAERGTFTTDFLSNGFKIRHVSGGTGTSGETYIYMAFAESPFVSSEGVPTTAV